MAPCDVFGGERTGKFADRIFGTGGFSLAGFFAAGFPLLQLANAALDQGAPTKYEQPVIDFVATDSGYRADVLSWRPERAIQPVRIDEEGNAGDPLHFADCRMLAIKTKPGFFGFEWISSVRPVQIEHRPRELTPEDSH